MKVMGLDPSTKTGFVWMEDKDGESLHVVQSGEITFPGQKGMTRVQSIGQSVKDDLIGFQPNLVVIEGYGFANKHTLVTLVEIGTAIRLALHESGIPWASAAPTQLKKFVSGKGNTKKDGIMLEVYKQWRFEGTDNECDAFGLAALGLYAGCPDLDPHLKADQRKLLHAWKAENLRLFI